MVIAEYIWYDGTFLRCKTKVFEKLDVLEFPEWYTYAENSGGEEYKFTIKPIRTYIDLSRGDGCFIVLCELINHTNYRSKLNELLPYDIKIGFEQEYLVFNNNSSIDFFKKQSNDRLGVYCGVGTDKVINRDLAEKHLMECLNSGVKICGINSESRYGQWEYQISHNQDVIKSCDDLIVSRFILKRLSEKFDLMVKFNSINDCNSSCHINFSFNDIVIDNETKTKIENVFEENHTKLKKELLVENRFDSFKLGAATNTTLNYRLDCFEYRILPADVNPYKACLEIITTLDKVFKK